MRELKSQSPTGLPDSFDAKIHSEEPIVEIDDACIDHGERIE